MKDIIVFDNVDIVTYSAAVREIAEKFFDEDGNYTPHFGRINSIGVFFNRFVDPVGLEAFFADKEVTIDLLASEEGCLQLYNGALNRYRGFRLDFANAYADALDIVKQRNTTIGGVINLITDSLGKLSDKISPVLTEKNIDKIEKISENIASGKLSADSIVEAIGKTIK
jgi:hypothetical protein